MRTKSENPKIQKFTKMHSKNRWKISAELSSVWFASILILVAFRGEIFRQICAQEVPTTPVPRLTRILELKDKIADRICDSTSQLLVQASSACGNASYCETMKLISENLPVGCGILNESFNDSVRQLALCYQKRDRETCVEGVVEDLKQKWEQMRTIGELAGRRRRRRRRKKRKRR